MPRALTIEDPSSAAGLPADASRPAARADGDSGEIADVLDWRFVGLLP